MPTPTNGYWDNPIVSRHHAVVRKTPVVPIPTATPPACLTDLLCKGLQITDLSSTHGTYLNGMKLDPDMPHYISNGDTITLGTLIASSTAGGPAHLPTRLEITFNNHAPPLLPPRPSQPQPQQDTPLTKPGARNTFHAPSDSEEEDITYTYKIGTSPSATANDVFAGKGFIKTWRPFPPMKVPHNDEPLPPLIDLTSDVGGVWEPAPVVERVEITSDAGAIHGEESEENEDENGEEEEEKEVHHCKLTATGGLGEFTWDDEEKEQQKSTEEVGLPETVTGVPETQLPDQPPKVQGPEPAKVRTAPPFPLPSSPLSYLAFRCRETNAVAY